MTKGFSEANRFHNGYPEQRKHGLKFVSPPVAETSLQMLKHENEFYKEYLKKKIPMD